MSDDRRARHRELARFFGLFMLAVQGWILFGVVKGTLAEVEITTWIDRVAFFDHLAWLKPALWQPPWFERYIILFATVCGCTMIGLSVFGLRRWRRAAQDDES